MTTPKANPEHFLPGELGDGFTTCVICGRRKPMPEARHCVRCGEELSLHPTVAASDQVCDAMLALERDPTRLVRWPWPALDRIAGPMAPGNVYYAAAFSGNGKTMLSQSAVRRWLQQGLPVYVLPLESRPDMWRAGLACMDEDVNPALALSGELRLREIAGDATARATRERLCARLTAQAATMDRQLYVDPHETINLAGLATACARAADLGSRIVVVDHVDHIGSADPTAAVNAVQESQRINREAVKLAQSFDLVLVLMSQLNMDITRADRLAKFQPPQLQQLMYPAVKTQVATGIIGFHRVINPRANTETLKRVRAGELDVAEVLVPGTMGAVVMKLRHAWGDAHEGARAQLGVHAGRVEELDDTDVRAVEADRHGIHTGGASERSGARDPQLRLA